MSDVLEPLELAHIANDPDFRRLIEECDRVLKSKGHDYTQGEPGTHARLKNFYEAAAFLGISPLQSLGNYWYKHVTAIFTFLKHGQVESEPIEGRIVDTINYLLLLYKMIQYERLAKVTGEEK